MNGKAPSPKLGPSTKDTVMKYQKHHPISLKEEHKEDWLKDIIEEDPSVLGLGNIRLVDRERKQFKGTVDFLFESIDDPSRRYVVEVQLGSPDGSHIVRSIEYWDVECRRYPGYDHCAVLIAENVVGRFQNVLTILNSSIPFILIQVQALKIGNNMTLTFTKILDEHRYNLIEGTMNDDAPKADAKDWIKICGRGIYRIVKEIEKITKKHNSKLKLNHTKWYIGLKLENAPCNFIKLMPRKMKPMLMEIYLDRSNEVDKQLDESPLDSEYYHKHRCYRLRLSITDIDSCRDTINELIKLAYDNRLS